MRHHHYTEYLHDDCYMDEESELEEGCENITDYDKIEREAYTKRNSRRLVDDYLENKKMREKNLDPFDQFFGEDK